MPALHNPRHERFARYFIRCGVASEAYRRAGYKADKPRSVWTNSWRMLRHEHVERRIRELKRQMASRNRITVDSLIEELDAAKAHAIDLKQPSVAVTAIMSKARLVGLLVDRKEQGAPGEFSGLQSEVETIAKVRAELGDDAASALAKALEQADSRVVPAEDEVDPLPPIEPTNSGNSTLN